jgi:hypothetical protein
MGMPVSRAARGSARTRSRDAEHGVAAVEFALVSGVFFLVLFGIIQYGLYFNDSIGARQGVREAARQGVVENFGFSTGCGSGSSSARLRCSTAAEIGAITGTPYVKVMSSATPWKQGDSLIVCAMVKANAGLDLVPLPDHGWVRTRTQMVIEQQTAAAGWTDSADNISGTGQTWSWCTP